MMKLEGLGQTMWQTEIWSRTKRADRQIKGDTPAD